MDYPSSRALIEYLTFFKLWEGENDWHASGMNRVHLQMGSAEECHVRLVGLSFSGLSVHCDPTTNVTVLKLQELKLFIWA